VILFERYPASDAGESGVPEDGIGGQASMNGPDFSHVNSMKKAEDLVRRGEVERLLLLPSEFGGEEIPENVAYVPAGIVAIKKGIDRNVIGPLVSAGKVTRYHASPEYHGDSFIPIAIKIEASDPAAFSTVINIWGQALGRDGVKTG
jgi:hypothetical protein